MATLLMIRKTGRSVAAFENSAQIHLHRQLLAGYSKLLPCTNQAFTRFFSCVDSGYQNTPGANAIATDWEDQLDFMKSQHTIAACSTIRWSR